MTDALRTTQTYLVCDPSSKTDDADHNGLWTRSPLGCLEAAIETVPAMILIRFPVPGDPIRETCLELCNVLKRNRRTRSCAVTALMPDNDSTLMDGLRSAGVDYAVTLPCCGLDDGKIRDILGSLDETHRVAHCRAPLCPYLRDIPIDEFRTMTVCGAYLDRMVLGGRRLHELCETQNHVGCEYFQNPRVRS